MYLRSTLSLFFLGVASGNQLREMSAPASTVEEVEGISLSSELMGKFHSWMEYHGKEYSSQEEKIQRLRTWIQNDVFIHEHNEKEPKPTYTLGHNAYSDMTPDEFERHFKLGKYAVGKEFHFDHDSMTEEVRMLQEQVSLPEEVNWIDMGGVTPVKNQGMCGSCWAFSTTGALEGAKFIKTGELVALSEQNLLDCDHKDLGCNGGLMDDAFKFDEKQGGLCSEEEYPYKAKAGTCKTDCTDVPGTLVTSFIDVPAGDQTAMMAAIAMQPIAIAIQANQGVFQFYNKGVITDDSCGRYAEIDHGVLAVGYGTDEDSGEPYYLVKNSWGPGWGSDGYVKLGRKSKNQYGICAILRMGSFPIVA